MPPRRRMATPRSIPIGKRRAATYAVASPYTTDFDGFCDLGYHVGMEEKTEAEDSVSLVESIKDLARIVSEEEREISSEIMGESRFRAAVSGAMGRLSLEKTKSLCQSVARRIDEGKELPRAEARKDPLLQLIREDKASKYRVKRVYAISRIFSGRSPQRVEDPESSGAKAIDLSLFAQCILMEVNNVLGVNSLTKDTVKSWLEASDEDVGHAAITALYDIGRALRNGEENDPRTTGVAAAESAEDAGEADGGNEKRTGGKMNAPKPNYVDVLGNSAYARLKACRSHAMRNIVKIIENSRLIRRILITGETGVGKELVARAFHFNSDRADRSLHILNVAAKSEVELGFALFGAVDGVYTDAKENKSGLLLEADNGTIFLDEIGDMKMENQVKLLRVIESGEFQAIGGKRTWKVDIRFISATNVDLEKATAEGRFRLDLFQRLKDMRIHVPPLRERKEDIIPLFDYFVSFYSRELNKRAVPGCDVALEKALTEYHWPGNVRELEKTCESAVALDLDGIVDLEDLHLDGASSASVRADPVRVAALSRAIGRSPSPAIYRDPIELPLISGDDMARAQDAEESAALFPSPQSLEALFGKREVAAAIEATLWNARTYRRMISSGAPEGYAENIEAFRAAVIGGASSLESRLEGFTLPCRLYKHILLAGRPGADPLYLARYLAVLFKLAVESERSLEAMLKDLYDVWPLSATTGRFFFSIDGGDRARRLLFGSGAGSIGLVAGLLAQAEALVIEDLPRLCQDAETEAALSAFLVDGLVRYDAAGLVQRWFPVPVIACANAAQNAVSALRSRFAAQADVASPHRGDGSEEDRGRFRILVELALRQPSVNGLCETGAGIGRRVDGISAEALEALYGNAYPDGNADIEMSLRRTIDNAVNRTATDTAGASRAFIMQQDVVHATSRTLDDSVGSFAVIFDPDRGMLASYSKSWKHFIIPGSEIDASKRESVLDALRRVMARKVGLGADDYEADRLRLDGAGGKLDCVETIEYSENHKRFRSYAHHLFAIYPKRPISIESVRDKEGVELRWLAIAEIRAGRTDADGKKISPYLTLRIDPILRALKEKYSIR